MRDGLQVASVTDTVVVPKLQVRFDDARGFIAFVDFFWRLICTVGEFDGQGKYVKEEYTNGRPTYEIVLQEKRREDRGARAGPHVRPVGLGDRLRPGGARAVPEQQRHTAGAVTRRGTVGRQGKA